MHLNRHTKFPHQPAATRSGFDAGNLQELFDAAASPQAALRTGQAQYLTPDVWAVHCARLLPPEMPAVLDPQAGDGALLRGFNAVHRYTHRFGVELDRRMVPDDWANHDIRRHPKLIRGNCVRFWDWCRRIDPEFTIPCHIANPPFGITWKLPGGGTCESTMHTWHKMLGMAGDTGCGYIIGGAERLERLNVRTHDWVYCWQRIEPEAGVFKGVTIPIAIAHWDASIEHRPARVELTYGAGMTPADLCRDWQPIVDHYNGPEYQERSNWWDDTLLAKHWETLTQIAVEDLRQNQPTHNVMLREDGTLRVHFSTLEKVTRKIREEDIKPVLGMRGAHPLTLTVEVATRRQLIKLLDDGTWTIQPEARDAIEAALEESAKASVPLMPPTDFALVAYADELDELTCRQAVDGLPFTPEKTYAIDPVGGGICHFSTPFDQSRRHLDPETGIEETITHKCALMGTDRYLSLRGDDGRMHYFVDRPEHTTLPGKPEPTPDQVHPESLLWEVFERPVVPDIATVYPDLANRTRHALIAQQPC